MLRFLCLASTIAGCVLFSIGLYAGHNNLADYPVTLSLSAVGCLWLYIAVLFGVWAERKEMKGYSNE